MPSETVKCVVYLKPSDHKARPDKSAIAGNLKIKIQVRIRVPYVSRKAFFFTYL